MALTEHITYIDPEDPREQPFRVYFVDGKPAAAIDALRGKEGIEFDGSDKTSPEDLRRLLSRENPRAPHALVVRSDTKLRTKKGLKDKGLPPGELEALLADSRLQLVIRAGIGVDNIDGDAMAEHGIVVENTPEANVNAVVTKTVRDIEYVFSEQFRANIYIKLGKVDKPKWTEHPDIYGNRTFGIVGLGNIGSRIALEIQKRGGNVIGYDPYVQLDGVENVSLEELCRRSDVISVHAALTESSDDMIGAQQFRLMKDGVVIINNARGGIVNERELLEKLNSGQVYAAVLDVFTIEGKPLADDGALGKLEPEQQEHVREILRPLINHPRTVASMHGGANSAEAQEGNGRDTAAQLINFAYGVGLHNATNFPSVSFPLAYKLDAESSYRVLLLNRNVQGVWDRVDAEAHGIHEGYNVEAVVGLPFRDKRLAARITEITFRSNEHIEAISIGTAQRIIRAMRDVENVLGVRMVKVSRRAA